MKMILYLLGCTLVAAESSVRPPLVGRPVDADQGQDGVRSLKVAFELNNCLKWTIFCVSEVVLCSIPGALPPGSIREHDSRQRCGASDAQEDLAPVHQSRINQ